MTEEEKLRDLLALTARLPREVPPPDDAWAGIRARIEAGDIASTSPAVWQRPAFLIAAGLLLAVGSSVVTARMVSNDSTRSETVAAAPQRSAPPFASNVSTLTEFTARENEYLERVNRLLTVIESGDTGLSPETVETLKESLRVIDGAILEARRALAADPANAQLIDMLSSSYEKKVDLLQRTTTMARS